MLEAIDVLKLRLETRRSGGGGDLFLLNTCSQSGAFSTGFNPQRLTR